MSVERFIAATARDAMREVRTRFGEDALVLSNRTTPRGVEILALAAADVEKLADVSALGGGAVAERLLQEIAGMRQLLDRRKAPAAPPAQEILWRHLRVAGFSTGLAQIVLNTLPIHPDADWLLHAIEARLQTAPADALLEAHAIVLVGPPGAGKSTLATQLAIHCTGQRRSGGAVLVNADFAHPGNETQLRARLEAAHVAVPILADETGPGHLIRSNSAALVIVDSPALDTNTAAGEAQIDAACRAGAVPVLVLDARLQAEALDAVVTRYRAVVTNAGSKLETAIITHRDTAPRLGPVLDVAIRRGLRIHYLAPGSGTAALAVADAHALATQALAAPARDLHAEAVPHIHQLLRQGRALGQALAMLRQYAPGFDLIEHAWPWQRLAPAAQQEQVQATPRDTVPVAGGWRWERRPDLIRTLRGLDASGLPIVGANIDLPAASDPQAAAGHMPQLTHATHLLPRSPGAAQWRWLTQHQLAWMAGARASTLAWHADKRTTLLAARAHAQPVTEQLLRLDGRSLQATFRHLPVALAPTGDRNPSAAPLTAWYIDLRDRASGAAAGTHYALTPRELPGEQALRLITWHLQTTRLPQLVQLALQRLAAQSTTVPGTGTQVLAESLAALALRLDAENAEWALALGTRLANLAGRPRARGARAVLEALVTLLVTRDALREVGSGSRTGA